MKIVHIVPNINDEASGPSYTVPRLCKSLANLKHKVVLSCIEGNSFSSNVKLQTHSSWPFLKRYGISHEHVKSSIKASNTADIVHNHILWSMVNIAAGWIVPDKKAKLVTSPRGTLSEWALRHHRFRKKLFWPMQKRLLEKADLIHATSKSEYEDIRRLGLKQPVIIIPNGIDIPDIGQKNSTNNERVILFLSRIHPKKGLELLINAWGSIENKYENWKLNIVGDGEKNYVSSLKNKVKNKNLNNVIFTGPLYGSEKQAAYQNADLFILPTHSENFGMVVAEALANACPAIVSQEAPWSGLKEHHCGWWIPNNIESLETTLDLAMSTPQKELQIMGSNGRVWMEQDFSWDKIAILMEEGYNWLINDGKLPKTVKKD